MINQLDLTMQNITLLILPGDEFILVDEEKFSRTETVTESHTILFLEEDGQYWDRF